MVKRNYSREQVVNQLSRLGIKLIGLSIKIPKGLDVGIKTWGKIDFIGQPWVRSK